MNIDLLQLSILQFIMALIFGVTLLYITYKIINKQIFQKYELEYTNISFAIVTGSMLYSVAYLIEGVRHPIVNTIRILKDNLSTEGWSFYLECAKYIGLFLFLSLMVIAITLITSTFLFNAMTRKINEFREIQKDNIAVGIISASIVLSISLLAKENMLQVLESFMPYPVIHGF